MTWNIFQRHIFLYLFFQPDNIFQRNIFLYISFFQIYFYAYISFPDGLWHISHQCVPTWQLQLHGSLPNPEQVVMFFGNAPIPMLITDIITGTLTLAFSLHRHIQDKPLLPSKQPPFVTYNHAKDPNSRINHSCLPNSHHWWNSEEGEKVLFCTENMQVGWTHFCIRPYLDLKGPNRVVFPVTEKRVMYQLTLNFLWSVICYLSPCICHPI